MIWLSIGVLVAVTKSLGISPTCSWLNSWNQVAGWWFLWDHREVHSGWNSTTRSRTVQWRVKGWWGSCTFHSLTRRSRFQVRNNRMQLCSVMSTVVLVVYVVPCFVPWDSAVSCMHCVAREIWIWFRELALLTMICLVSESISRHFGTILCKISLTQGLLSIAEFNA